MKFAQPVKSICNQKIAHFVTAIVENVSTPITMLTFARVEMLVKRGAIETSECKRIFRKMRRHPIHDHADSVLMKMIDQQTKIVGRAIPRSRSRIRADLL